MEHGPVREMIHAYLKSYSDAERRRGADELEGWEAHFLDEHAVERLKLAYRRAVADRNARFSDPPAIETIRIVELSAVRVVAEVSANRNVSDALPVPFFATRFVVIKSDARWLVESILQPCLSCNLRSCSGQEESIARTPGKCFLCRGSGFLTIAPKPQGWLFWRAKPPQQVCIACHGKGACDKCADEPVPGWNRIASLIGIPEEKSRSSARGP